ncbi:MAG: hypothetical protein A2Y14_00545 [Verrucomicrobia bacterium GWF2_51_19]|nr:MAG: hypothetical protein A2Y14_00545 [Verrucomicrobia bacterium GWF2_51_19]HCJ12426.1 hypothetical protein [Opitutae bacterium]
MNTTSQSIRVGLFFIFGVLMIWLVHQTLNKTTFYQHSGYEIRARFTDLKQLKPGDDVRLSGVRIGAIENTTLEDDFGVAILNIETQFTIPKDSVAIITSAGMLGANYVAIQAGKDKDDLAPKSYIKTQYTADFAAVVSQFGNVGKRLDSLLTGVEEALGGSSESDGEGQKSSGTLLSKVGDFFDVNRPKLDRIIDNLANITDQLKSGKGTFGRLIYDEELYAKVMTTLSDIQKAANKADGFLSNADGIVDKINKGQGTIGALFTDDTLGQKIRATVDNVHQFSEKLNADNNTLGRLITDDSLYTKAEDTLNKVDGAVDSMQDSGPVTAIGVLSNALF